MIWIAILLSFAAFSLIGFTSGTFSSVESFLNALPLIGPIIEGKGLMSNLPEGFLVFSITALINTTHSAHSSSGQFLERFITAVISSFIVAVIRMTAGEAAVRGLAALAFCVGGILLIASPEAGKNFWKTLFASIFAYGVMIVIIQELR